MNEFGEVTADLLDGAGDAAARATTVPDHHPCPVAEVVLVLARDTEKVADRVDGEGEGEVVNEVGLALRREAVDEVVSQLLDTRRECGDAPRSERLGDEAAKPGVIRRVDVEQMGHQIGAALAGDSGFAFALRVLGVVLGILRQPTVREGLAGIGIAGHQPCFDAARQLGPMDGGVLTEPGVGRIRVGGELPGEEFGRGVRDVHGTTV